VPARSFVSVSIDSACRSWRGACCSPPAIKYLELRSGLDLNHEGLRIAAQHQDTIRLLIPEEGARQSIASDLIDSLSSRSR